MNRKWLDGEASGLKRLSLLLLSQVRPIQARGPLGGGLQGQYAALRRRREPALPLQLPVEVQLRLSHLDPGGHAAGLRSPEEDPPQLHRSGPRLQEQQPQEQIWLGDPDPAAGLQNEAVQEQVFPGPARLPRIRRRHRAGDVQPGPPSRHQTAGLRTDQQRDAAAWKLSDV